MRVPTELASLEERFAERLQVDVSLASYTAARIGGPADGLLIAHSADELSEIVIVLWEGGIPFLILGGGSNVLVADRGVRGVVILNRAREIRFKPEAEPPTVWAESGASFSSLARQAAQRGLGGLEWAAGIPGTLGGAVVGNAGAHGSDLAGNLIQADILQLKKPKPQIEYVREDWAVERMEYGYRESVLKRNQRAATRTTPGQPAAVVLAALLRLEQSDPLAVKEQTDQYTAYRRKTQPPGASMGSMFKNPPNDHAGRLIEACGLKGLAIGGAQISPIHANFFMNNGGATSSDALSLINRAHQEVLEKFAVDLELEIELIGEFE